MDGKSRARFSVIAGFTRIHAAIDSWALFATPGDYTCQSSSDGGTVCFKWVVPRPPQPTPTPEPQRRAPHHQ